MKDQLAASGVTISYLYVEQSNNSWEEPADGESWHQC